MLRAAIIGIGHMGKLHVKAYNQISGVKLVAVSDTDPQSFEKTKLEPEVKKYTDYKEMLEKEQIDLISIVVPSDIHKNIALEVIRKKISLIIEKPLAMTIDECKEIILEAEKNNVLLMVGHIERFNPVIDTIKKNIDPKSIISIHITRVGPYPPRMGNIGIIKDIGVHDIDLIRYITESEFESVNCVSAANIGSQDDTASMSFKMKSGAVASINTNWLTPYKQREIEICTKDKLLKADLMTYQVTEYGSYSSNYTDSRFTVNKLSVQFGESIIREIDSFVNSVKNKQPPLITGEDGMKALEIAQRCADRSKNNKDYAQFGELIIKEVENFVHTEQNKK